MSTKKNYKTAASYNIQLTEMQVMIFKNEAQLQAAVVKEFYTKHPKLYGCLFMLHNESMSMKNASINIAKGLFPGASDLMLQCCGMTAFVELKHEGNRQKVGHVKKQIAFGETMIEHGAYFLISSEFFEVMCFLNSVVCGESHYQTIKYLQDRSLTVAKCLIADAESRGVGSLVWGGE